MAFISIFGACQKPPTSCFVTDKTIATVNSPIECDASCSQNAKKYYWLCKGTKTFNDDASPKETFTFNIPGTYTIKLQAINRGKDDMISHIVTIY